MLKKPVGFDNAKEEIAMPKLPRGNYVCMIKKAEAKITNYGTEIIAFEFDIWEGQHQNFYETKLEHESLMDANARWKGNISLALPPAQKKNETEEEFADRSNKINRFKKNIACFEASNPGFHFDWDSPKGEQQFEGLVIGIKFQPNIYEIGDKKGEWQKPKYFCDANAVRDGSEKVLDLVDDTMKGHAAERYIPKAERQTETATSTVTVISDEDLPF